MTVEYGENFLIDHAGNIIRDPKIALIEIIANAYDAGSITVKVKWPEGTSKKYSIDDDGIGLNEQQFKKRWETLSYDRFKTQGEMVTFPKDVKNPPQRSPFGKNGKGRHAPFCFNDEYEVESSQDDETFNYTVTRALSSKAPFNLKKNEVRQSKKKHGISISGTVSKNYISTETVENLIKSKFLFDPTFNIHLNDKKINLLNLDGLEAHELKVPGHGKVTIYLIDSSESENKSRFKGIAWWINRRLVGSPDWKNILTKSSYLDKRRSLAKKISFIVEADILGDCVSADWLDLYSTEKSEAVVGTVEKFIFDKVDELMAGSRMEEKDNIIRDNLSVLERLNSKDQKKVDDFIDMVQQKCKRIQYDDFSNVINIIGNLENSYSGFELFEELSKLSSEDLDNWTEIIKRWDAKTALTILDEIENRLRVISEIEKKCDHPETKELLELHPLIEKSLWVFGPEYEGIEYHSNKTLKTILNDKYGVSTNSKSKGASKRPDFYISVVERDGYDDDSECNGTEKVVIIELKRGGYEIDIKDLRQGQDYAYLLKEKHPELEKTKFVVWAIGSKTHRQASEQVDSKQNVFCYSMSYRTLVKRANARLFQLKRKIEEVKGNEDIMKSRVRTLIKQEGVQSSIL
jgi:hypothetical protein